MFQKVSDNAIIEGIRRQDVKILTWLYDNYRESVRHYVLKNSGNEADVSDVFQESMIILYDRITSNELDLTSDLKGFFFGIAKNTWCSQLRKMARISGLESDPPDESDEENADDHVLERIVSRAFLKLKEDAQAVLKLFSEGHSYEEIAVKMNLKNEVYARRKKYLSKEALMELIKADPEYKNYLNLR